MKNILLFFSTIALLTSCSNDDSNEKTILPKTITYKYSNSPGDDDVSKIVYDGNKIVSASYTANDKEVYTYTGDLITKIEDFAEEGNISSINEFTYENGKLKIDLLTETGGSTTYISKKVYAHNTDGTISFIEYAVDPDTKAEEKKSEGILTYSNGNLIKKTEDFQGGSYVKTYEYDDKNNPIKNILGYNLLIDYDSSASLNNVVKMTRVYDTAGTEVFTSIYEYNDKGYPVKQTQTSENSVEIREYTY